MALDLVAIASSVVSSFLYPYVKDGAEKLAAQLTEKATGAAAEHASGVAAKIWGRISSVFNAGGDAQVLEMFKQYPDETKGLVQTKLREKLEQDPALAQELDSLTKQPSPDGSGTAVHVMENSGYIGQFIAPGATFSGQGGVYAGIVVGAQAQPPSPSSPDAREKS